MFVEFMATTWSRLHLGTNFGIPWLGLLQVWGFIYDMDDINDMFGAKFGSVDIKRF